jgi:hypothetical protein
MANFNGSYQVEWEDRVKYFNKEAKITVNPVIKTVWAPKIYNPFYKKKKIEDTKLQKGFGHLDNTYTNMIRVPPKDFKRAAMEFRKAIEAATRQGKKSLAEIKKQLEAKNEVKLMTATEKKQHEKNVANLSKLYQRDLESVIYTAQAALFREVKLRNEKGERDDPGRERLATDAKARKKALHSTIVKGLAWLNKLDRDPTVDNFNVGFGNVCRDITSQIEMCREVFTTPRDKQMFDTADKLLVPFGDYRNHLREEAGREGVMETSAKMRKVMLALEQWVKSTKT